MRMSAKEFAARPSYDLVTAFGAAHDNARALPRDDGGRERERQQKAEIAAMQTKVAALKDSFSGLIRTQEWVGFAENEGLNQKLATAGREAERLIVEDLTELPGVDVADGSELCWRPCAATRRNIATRATKLSVRRFADGFLIFNTASDAFDLVADDQGAGSIARFRPMSTRSREWALAASRVRPWVTSIDAVERGDAARRRPDHRVGARARRRCRGHARRRRRTGRAAPSSWSAAARC